MITAGVDVGSLTGKTVIFEDNHIVSWSLVQTGPDSAETAKEAVDVALQKANLTLDKLEFIVSTGYGR
ncbi:MAG TPA: 2-hydroxyglutaryl-CoA dehydratase, partial [Dehalococcoidia bacterium]|nr:2-hydroxyglutaryl-CoA dehydratase [Dehalococcoidia bacterium]